MTEPARPALAVCVFCASASGISGAHLDLAAEVGTELARRGHVLISGGGLAAAMGAVARAARDGGARTVGVIPQALAGAEIADSESDELLVTADMCTRKAEMMRRADAYLTLPGGLGTLDELLEVWTTRALGLHGKPVVVLDPDGIFAPFREFTGQLCAQGFVRPGALDVVTWVTSAAAALDAIEQQAVPAQASPRRVQDGSREPRMDSTISTA
ncbi:MAG TPA: TIGR00730 family Rossman fold protein [Streptosporangiaceae bacterium]|nr:TIGR00730 family Rossman fold protein [Streptosporangiaceae bacterium]